MPLSVVQDRRARGKFKEWRDGMATNPRKADYAWTVLARVISVAKDRGLIAVNVCERGGRLYEADRAEIIWLPEHTRGVLFGGIARTAVCIAARTLDRPASGDVDRHRLVSVRRHAHAVAAEQATTRKKEKANCHPGRRTAENRARRSPP